MLTVAIINQKGGSGKTTTAVNLAAALAEKGKRVLVIDVDPQASASKWLGIRDGGKGLFTVFTENGNLSAFVANTAFTGIDVIPASTWLVGVERAMAGEVGAELVLRRAIRRLPQERWHYVLIDCPPSLGLLSISALAASDKVLVPVESHVMALDGLAALLQTVERVRERLGTETDLWAVLPCRVDMRKNLCKDVLSKLQEGFGSLVLKAVIRENVRIAECPSFFQPVTAYDSKSTGAADYRAVASELLKKARTQTKMKEVA